MKPRPPSLRFKRRYILVKVVPRWYAIDGREMYPFIAEAICSLWGDAVAAEMQPAVVFCEKGFAIIRCRRGTEQKLGTALATVTGASERPFTLRALATSGTILTLKRKLQILASPMEKGVCTVKGCACSVCCYDNQKVDVIERGIKGQNLVFLTKQDSEEMECNHNTRWDTTGQ